MGLAPFTKVRNLVPWRCDICHTTGRTKPVRSDRRYMEEDTVTTVNEQLENLEDSTEDSGQEKLAAQASQVNPDTTVDEDSRRAPDNNELTEPSRDETSEASNGNLEE